MPDTFPKTEDTPEGTFQRLFLEFRQLRFERRNAQHELIRHFFAVAGEFYGAAVAATTGNSRRSTSTAAAAGAARQSRQSRRPPVAW